MRATLTDFSLKVDSPVVTPQSLNFRPTTWPPSADWPVVVDAFGAVVSRWSDKVWDLTVWSGKPYKLNFEDSAGRSGASSVLDADNADLLRLAMGWLIWGPRSYNAPGTIKNRFTQVRAVVALCSKHKISAASLMRYPQVQALLPTVIARSKWEETIAVLHRLYDAREELGFTVVDTSLLRRLAGMAIDHVGVQTPYIPPRIWVYQINRLRECLEDFSVHSLQVEACFRYCLDAYATNYGSLEAALTKGKDTTKGPFTASSGRRGPDVKYLGPFLDVAEHHGINELLRKWITRERPRVSMLSSYMTLVSTVGLSYIANFTLQRKEEAASIRASCLLWEVDEKLGRVPIICGETTKTEHDSDARWVASPSVELAVQVLATIARLRMLCDRVNIEIQPSATDQNDPYLSSSATEPWGYSLGYARRYNIRAELPDLKDIVSRYPLLFDQDDLRITAEDLKVALRLTPNLPSEEFDVGKVWPLAWHQFRRTGAVNMFASGVISDSSMQQQMHHSSRLMPLYYGRNYTRLRLNKEVEKTVINGMYEAMAERLKSVVSDRFVSPHSDERKDILVVSVLKAKDARTLVKWAAAGKVSFRETRLGGCMKPGPCEYGGVESVAQCGGGGEMKPCTEALFNHEKAPQVRAELAEVIREISQSDGKNPRTTALVSERDAMENFLNVISSSR